MSDLLLNCVRKKLSDYFVALRKLKIKKKKVEHYLSCFWRDVYLNCMPNEPIPRNLISAPPSFGKMTRRIKMSSPVFRSTDAIWWKVVSICSVISKLCGVVEGTFQWANRSFHCWTGNSTQSIQTSPARYWQRTENRAELIDTSLPSKSSWYSAKKNHCSITKIFTESPKSLGSLSKDHGNVNDDARKQWFDWLNEEK